MKPIDPLIDRLCEEAQRFDPAPPAGLRRTVLAAIAHTKPRGSTPIALRWSLAGGLVAAVAVIAWFRHLPDPTSSHGLDRPVVVQTGPNTELIQVAVAQLWSRDPLEGEVHNLLTSFNNARDTVTTVLPAAVKRSQPTTQSPREIRPL